MPARLTELGEVELRLLLAEPGRAGAACAPRRRAAGCELLPDHPQRQELVALQPQDRLQPLDVLLAEEPVAAARALRRQQPLVLEVADLRDRDVLELGLQPRADRADRVQALLGRRSVAVVCSSAQEGQAVLADLELVVVLELGRLDPLLVHERAVEAAEVGDRERLAVAHELCVLARDGDVVEEHVALGRAADQRALGRGEEALPRPAAAGANDERRALAREVVQRRRPDRRRRPPGCRSSSARPPRPCSASRRSGSRNSRPPDSGTRTQGNRRDSRALFGGGALRDERMSVSFSTSTSVTPFPFSRAVRSARRMSIRPWSSRRRKETSFSSCVELVDQGLEVVVGEGAEVGQRFRRAFPCTQRLSVEVRRVSKAARAPRGQPQLEASTEVRGAAASPCMISSTSSRTSCSSSSET